MEHSVTDIDALVITAFVLIAAVIGVGVAIDRQRPLRAAQALRDR